MQNTLFDSSEQATAEHLKLGEIAVVGSWRVRNFHGYHQSSEAGGRWLFWVSGFGRVVNGEHVECSLVRIDGTRETVPIDSGGRITVLGRKYSDSHWQH